MEIPVRPIVLLADSQLLFHQPAEGEGEPFVRRLRSLISSERPRAAYIGASNGDEPAFYELFQSAMESAGIFETRHIPAEPSGADWDFFDESDLVLLAGGDPARGWRTFRKNGLKQKIIERYYAGAVLVGLSAGAVQLGLRGYREDEDSGETRLFEAFKLVPALVDAHAEPEWERLSSLLPRVDEPTHGLGIPSGGGAFLHPDLTLEPIRRPVTEIRLTDDGEIVHNLIFPPDPAEIAAAEAEAAEAEATAHAAARAAKIAEAAAAVDDDETPADVELTLDPEGSGGSGGASSMPRILDVEAVEVDHGKDPSETS